MRNVDEDTITQIVLARHAEARNPRLKQIMTSVVQHLHAFARDVELTEEEWFQGIQFLTDVGHITDDKRQEFILLSDTLGLSMLVTALNNRKPVGCTESTVFGPFFVENAPEYENGDDVANGAKGEPCFVTGRITGLAGEPVPNAHIEVWQADSDGFYDVQYRRCNGKSGARRAKEPRGRFIPLPLDYRGVLSDSARRSGGANAESPWPPSVATGASALHDRGAWLRAPDYPCVSLG